MIIFKTADKHLEKLGFKKICDDEYVVTYERYNKMFLYTELIEIGHKESGRHLIHFCQKGVNTDNYNNSVGMTGAEIKWALRKMKEKGWYSNKSSNIEFKT